MVYLNTIQSSDIIVFFFAGLMTIILLFGFILYFLFTYRHKQRDFNLLQLQKDEIDTQKHLLENTLNDLKLTQTQLIHSEKMASLGELTAGIAHEIQNPLNFVNNFSDVNIELLNEMITALDNQNYSEIKIMLNDVLMNETKINDHGKRADGIIKSMLQHSRKSSGIKEPININTLADEYMRLAYHGFRAKDKSFNAKTETDFDDSVGPVNVVPQDIGRVILNLITNAFYAVSEKKKSTSESYEPIVSINTRKKIAPGGKPTVILSVRDNGNGIPKEAIDKIFQPFFTTKPSGQGTGLGLSLSYDIVKAHGGDLKVSTKEGEYAEFIITLPIQNG